MIYHFRTVVTNKLTHIFDTCVNISPIKVNCSKSRLEAFRCYNYFTKITYDKLNIFIYNFNYSLNEQRQESYTAFFQVYVCPTQTRY